MKANVKYQSTSGNQEETLELKTTKNNKIVIECRYASALAGQAKGTKIEINGKPAVIDGVGKRFGDGWCYVYFQYC